MNMIPQTNPDEKTLSDALNFFFDNFVSRANLMAMSVRKVKGVSVMRGSSCMIVGRKTSQPLRRLSFFEI